MFCASSVFRYIGLTKIDVSFSKYYRYLSATPVRSFVDGIVDGTSS